MSDILVNDDAPDTDHSVAAKAGKISVGEDSIAKLFSGIEPGSLEAKKIWAKVDAEAHSDASVAKAQHLAGKKAVGWYKDGPLVPGESGEGQRDWQFLHDKLVFSKGYSPEVANKICGKIAAGLR